MIFKFKIITVGKYILSFIASVLMLQSWIPYPKYITIIANSGWFLSALVLLYILTIPLHKLISNINKKNKLSINILIVLCSLLMIVVYHYAVPKNGYLHYYFPIYRIFEYIIGIALWNIFIEIKKHNISSILVSISEIICILVLGIMPFLKVIYVDYIFVSVNILLLLSVVLGNGIVGKALSNKVFVWLGNISFEMYLLHFPVINYVFFIWKRIFPVTTISMIFYMIVVLLITIILSYVIHCKLGGLMMSKKGELKDKLIRFMGNFKKKKFKSTDFTIISNNCFGGIIYRNNNIPFQSPTCGLFIMPDDYIKFIYKMKNYLEKDMTEISINESKYKDYLIKINYEGTIGKVGDIEIMFLHYKDFNEAKEKWYRRAKRINYDKIIYKFSDQNNCTYQNLIDFQNFKAKNKICFTAKKYDGVDSIVFSEFTKDGYVVNDTKEKIFKKYFNIYDYINRI